MPHPNRQCHMAEATESFFGRMVMVRSPEVRKQEYKVFKPGVGGGYLLGK
jgi:hypothetical protein